MNNCIKMQLDLTNALIFLHQKLSLQKILLPPILPIE